MSTSSSGKERGMAKAPPRYSNARNVNQEMPSPSHSNESWCVTALQSMLVPAREADVTEEQVIKLNEFLTEVVQEMYPFLSRFKVKYDEIEDMIFEKTLDWLENPRENASYSTSEMELHDKLWSVMKTDKDRLAS